jgi:hypothetical protein
MSKGQSKFGGLTRGQMRGIAHSTWTIRQLAIHYGVPDKVIRGVKISMGHNRVAWHAARAV